jgi:hypothetical protein
MLGRAVQAATLALRVPPRGADTAEILMLARVVHLLSVAHLRVVGGLP